MLSFTYKLTSYQTFLQELAKTLDVEMQDDVLHLPEAVGEGFLKAIGFKEADALLYAFKLKDDFIFKRQKDEKEYYTLIYDELLQPENFLIQIGTEVINESKTRTSAIYLTSFLYDIEYTLYKDVFIRGVRICLSKDWMQQYLELPSMEDVLEKYISMKTENIWYKPVDPGSREILQELLNNKNESLLYYQNRIMRMVEIFFQWLRNDSAYSSLKSSISREDIGAAQIVESILTDDSVVIPPTIKELSRKVAMSDSKLKKIFKSVYGLPIYEYFQKHRMQKARLLLLSGNYSIKDVGYTLGYSNLSNFTLAFKKEFNKLPSEITKELR
jgi:AraC-like DNA-binding protein